MTTGHSMGDRTAIPAVIVGTVAWIVALLAITLTQGAAIPDTGVWWWGVTAIGTFSGLVGLIFLRWRRSRLER